MGKIKAKESQNVEYKRIWKDEYLKWICGFANAQGAVMYFGVDDSHEIIGLDHVDRLMEDIPNKIITTMGIVTDVNLHDQDGLEYIELTIAPSSMPISFKGKYYYRTGSTMQELTGSALTDFLMRKMNVTWDATTEPAATIDDINPSAVRYFLKSAIREGRISSSAQDDSVEQVLKKLHLINEESGQLTIAALLLFGKDVERWNMSSAFRIGRFGNSQADLIIQDRIVCPLIEMPSKVVEALKAKYLVSPIKFEGLQRIERLEIPEDALREMLCNSIVHRDYTSTFIQMKIFDDRITLWNSGTLPPNYTVEKLMEEHESHPRNKLIANTFYLAGFIETWGRGYVKIRDSFQKENLEIPTFEEVRGGFMATIRREKFLDIQKGQNNKKNVTKDVTNELSERQRVILNLIEENAYVTIPEMSRKTGVVDRTVKRDIENLQTKGIITREGSRKEGRWVIINR